MRDNLLEIGESIAIKAGLPVPVGLVGNSDRNARTILRSIRDGTSKDAFRDVDWIFLQKEHLFTTASAGYYNLPEDFDRIINNTVWDRTNDRTVIGPVSATKWQDYESGLTGLTGLQRICRLAGPSTNQISDVDRISQRRMRIYPDTADSSSVNAAADPIDVFFEYISNQMIQASSAGEDLNKFKNEWTSDTDKSLIDSDVIEAAALWRLLRTLGMSFYDEREEYNALVAERASNDAGAETLSMVQRDHRFWANVPETGYGD